MNPYDAPETRTVEATTLTNEELIEYSKSVTYGYYGVNTAPEDAPPALLLLPEPQPFDPLNAVVFWLASVLVASFTALLILRLTGAW